MNPVIKWSGSKRSQASKIMSFFPAEYKTYYEPFVGGGSILYEANRGQSVCGDICEPLIALWNEIKNNPDELADQYELRWTKLKNEGYTVYYDIREEYNRNHSPFDLLFLSRTCVNGLIRFNDKGEFNNSLHYSRDGIKPEKLRLIIQDWSRHIKGTSFSANDYEETTSMAGPSDIVYLDPPYFHTKGRYFGTIDFDRFLAYLEKLNSRGVKFILSFDGIRGDNNYTVGIPKELYKRHEFIASGYSTFRKVIDKEAEPVQESLYISF